MAPNSSFWLCALGQRPWILFTVAVAFSLIALQYKITLQNGKLFFLVGSSQRALLMQSEGIENIACPLNRKYTNEFAGNYSQHRDYIKERLLEVRKMWQEENAKVYVQHIHKGGGSTLCDFLAGLRHLGVSHENNCNGPREFFHITASNFKSIEDHMDSRKERFVFNERSMASIDSSEEAAEARRHFILLTSIRHPLDRIVSHMAHVYGRSIKDTDDVDELVAWLRRFLKDSVPNETLLSKEKGEFHHHENNFESMVLLGRFHEQTSTTPVSATNALEALDAFDIVIPTDQLSDGLQVIQSIVAPKVEKKIQTRKVNARATSRILLEAIRSRDELRDLYIEILSENCADLALYQRTRMIFQMIMESDMSQHS